MLHFSFLKFFYNSLSLKARFVMPFCVIKSRTIKIFLAMLTVVVLLCVSFEGGAAAHRPPTLQHAECTAGGMGRHGALSSPPDHRRGDRGGQGIRAH